MHDLDKLNRERRGAEFAQLDAARAMLTALQEIITINDESAGDCRKRMGTRRGNSIVAAQAAIAAAKAAGVKTEGLSDAL